MQNILLSTEVYKGYIGVSVNYMQQKGEGGRGKGEGGLSEIDYHPIKEWGWGRNVQTPVVALH